MAATHPDRYGRVDRGGASIGAPDAGKWGAARGCPAEVGRTDSHGVRVGTTEREAEPLARGGTARPLLRRWSPTSRSRRPGSASATCSCTPGIVSRDALERVSQHANGTASAPSSSSTGMIAEDDVTRALSEQLHVPVVDLRDAAPEPAATALVDPPDAHRHDVLPLLFADGALTVAVADPLNAEVMALLRSLPVKEVHVALGVPAQLRNRVNQTYSALSAVSTDIEAFQAERRHRSTRPGTIETVVDSHAPIVQVVNKIVTQALRDRASDVHIEPRRRLRARAFPHRRCAQRSRRAAQRDGPGARQPHQDHGRHEHRRAAPSARRSVRDEHRRPRPRRARVDHVDDLGREDGAPVARPHPLALRASATSACRPTPRRSTRASSTRRTA